MSLKELEQFVPAEGLLKEVPFLRVYAFFVEPRSHLAAGRSAAPPIQGCLGHWPNLAIWTGRIIPHRAALKKVASKQVSHPLAPLCLFTPFDKLRTNGKIWPVHGPLARSW